MSAGRRHAAVERYIKDKDWHFVSKDLVTRAGRVLQSLALEAESRGFTVRPPEVRIWTRPRAEAVQRSHLLIDTPVGLYGIRIMEVAGPGGAKKSPYPWQQPKSMPEWRSRRAWEFIPTGKLELRVCGPKAKHDGDRYRDSISRPIEDRIPEVFGSFERYASEIEQRRSLREQEAERRRVEDQLAEERAEEARYQETLRQALDQQLEDWERTRKVAAYLAEIAPAVAAIEDEAARSRALEWYEWIQAHVEETNPLGKALLDPPLRKAAKNGASSEEGSGPLARHFPDGTTKWHRITEDGEPRPRWSSFSK